MARLRTRALLGGATVALACGLAVAPAGADSIVFTDGVNVYAAPDGRPVVQLTADGTPDSPPYGTPGSPRSAPVGPYFSASADDQGRLLVARAWRDGDGGDAGSAWLWLAPDGRLLASNLVSMRIDCGSFARPIGPASARIHPSGRWVAFMYACGADTQTAINFPDRPTEPWFQPPEWGFFEPTWHGDRLVGTDMTAAVAQRPGDAAPFEDTWYVTDIRAADVRFGRTEYTRDGTRAATLVQIQGGQLLALVRTAPPLGGGAQAELQCFVPTRGSATTMSWSPAGDRIAWRDDAGVHVAAVPPREAIPGDDGLCAMQPRLVAAGGIAPVFTAYTYGTAPGGGGGGAGGGGQPGGGQATGGTLRVSAPARVTVRALRRGVPLSVTAPAAGGVTAQARAGRALVAQGAARPRRRGATRVTLRLTRAGGRARLAGRRLTVRVTFTPRGGGRPVTAQRTLRVR